MKTKKEDLVPKYLLKHLGITTQRQYKEIYRKRIRAVEKAFKEYWSGSAWANENEDDHALLHIIRNRIQSLSQKEWGR